MTSMLTCYLCFIWQESIAPELQAIVQRLQNGSSNIIQAVEDAYRVRKKLNYLQERLLLL